MFKQVSKSQLEVILIVLFLLILIAIAPKGLISITGKTDNDYGYCGNGVCDLQEDRWNCPQDCEIAPPQPERPRPAYVPSTPTCDLSQQSCKLLTPPKDFDSEICECKPFDYCRDIPNYEACTSEQHCPSQSQYLYQYSYITKDALQGCCQKGKCEAGKLCSTTASKGTCRTNRAYIGGPCKIKEPNDGICKLEAEPDTCYCEPKAPECSEGVKECVYVGRRYLQRKYCKEGIWITENCPYGCKNGECLPGSEYEIETKPKVAEEPLLIFSSEAGADVCNNIEAIPSACRGKVPNKKFTIGRSDWYCTEECEPITVTTAKEKPYETTDNKKICKDDSSVHAACRSKEIGTECEFKRGRETLKGICNEACKCDTTLKKPERLVPKEECQNTGPNFILSNNKCVCKTPKSKDDPTWDCKGKEIFKSCSFLKMEYCTAECLCKTVSSCSDINGIECPKPKECQSGKTMIISKGWKKSGTGRLLEETSRASFLPNFIRCCVGGTCETPPKPEKPAFQHMNFSETKYKWICNIYDQDPCYNKAIGERCDTIFQFARTCNSECKCIPVKKETQSPRK